MKEVIEVCDARERRKIDAEVKLDVGAVYKVSCVVGRRSMCGRDEEAYGRVERLVG